MKATAHMSTGMHAKVATGLRPAPLPQRDSGLRLDPLSAALVRNAPLRALMIQTALLAQLHGMAEEADTIRRLIVRLGVDPVLFDVARAIVLLHRGEPEACIRVVERDVLLADPGHELGRAVLLCAWRRQGRKDWQAHANALLASSADPRVHRMVLHGA